MRTSEAGLAILALAARKHCPALVRIRVQNRSGIRESEEKRTPLFAGLSTRSLRAFTADLPAPDARRSGPTRAWDQITKIRDAVNVGLQIDIRRTTVANILHEAGIVPAPERKKKRTWKQFLRSHWHCLYACDFFDVEILGILGTVRYSVFFVIGLQTRTVEIAGIRGNPDGEWMKQVARNLTDSGDGFVRRKVPNS